MNSSQKPFDCVQMKHDIQTKLQKEFEGMTGEEIRRKIGKDLEQSNTPYAQALRETKTRKTLVR